MKTTKFFGALLLAGLIVAGLGVVLPVSTVTSSVETKSFDPIPVTTETLILDATVQIFLYAQVNDLGELVYERGLGTLVQLRGEYLVYTHDHWGEIENPARAEFRNALGELLLGIDYEAFEGLIRHQDGGSMVLEAPVQIRPEYLAALIHDSKTAYQRPLVAINLTGPVQPAVGDQVIVVRRAAEDRSRVELIPARIEALSEEDGVSIYRLRSQEGQVIIPGDSGGGIWLDGQLIGNMWWSEYVYDWRFWRWEALQPEHQYMNRSVAAALPEVISAPGAGDPLATVSETPPGLQTRERED